MELVIYSQDEGSMFIWNMSKNVPDYTNSPRKTDIMIKAGMYTTHGVWNHPTIQSLYLFSQMLMGDKEHVLADTFYCAHISSTAAALQNRIQCWHDGFCNLWLHAVLWLQFRGSHPFFNQSVNQTVQVGLGRQDEYIQLHISAVICCHGDVGQFIMQYLWFTE